MGISPTLQRKAIPSSEWADRGRLYVAEQKPTTHQARLLFSRRRCSRGRAQCTDMLSVPLFSSFLSFFRRSPSLASRRAPTLPLVPPFFRRVPARSNFTLLLDGNRKQRWTVSLLGILSRVWLSGLIIPDKSFHPSHRRGLYPLGIGGCLTTRILTYTT